jgi:hypothetical protein
MSIFARLIVGATLALGYLVVIVTCDFAYIWLGDHVTPALHLSAMVQQIIAGVCFFVPLVMLFLTGALAQRIGLIEGSESAALALWVLGLLLCGANYFLLLLVWLVAAPRLIL